MLLACVSVLSISRCERNMLRSPFSMYSVTMHKGSEDTHTHSSRMMLGSFRRDMILISFRKSFLRRERRGHISVLSRCSNVQVGKEGRTFRWLTLSLHRGSYLAWLVASALSCFTATRTECPSLSGSGEPSPRNSGRPSASHRWTCRSRSDHEHSFLWISLFPQVERD